MERSSESYRISPEITFCTEQSNIRRSETASALRKTECRDQSEGSSFLNRSARIARDLQLDELEDDRITL